MSYARFNNVKSSKLRRMYWRFFRHGVRLEKAFYPELANLQFRFANQIEEELNSRGETVVK